MPSLRTLLSDIEPPLIGNPDRVFFVVNTNHDSQSGGCCLLWTVPAGTTRVTFEMWGGGGDGQGARCCEAPGTMPTNGSYAVKHADTVAGCQYRICAAGTGCYGCCCGIGVRALPSFVYDVSAASTIGCAIGGNGGCSQMTRGGFFDGYNCCWALMSGTGLGDMVQEGTGGQNIRTHYCRQHHYMWNAGGWGADRKSSGVCATDMTRAGCDLMTSCSSPSGAGNPGRACGGGFCRGQHGGYGIVKVSYT